MARKKGNRRTNGKNKSSSTSRSSSEEPISSSGESTESVESSAESSAESSVILLESSAEFNFENNLDFRARNLLGKTIKVGANYFDKSYSAKLLSQGKEYEEHIIQRFVSQEDYIKNKVAREFVKNSFTGRRATVVAQDYWFAKESWRERGELVVAYYPFTITQLKKWNNHVPSISDAKKCIQDLIVKSRMEALEKRRRAPTVDPQRTETVSSDSEWLETVSEKVNLVGRNETIAKKVDKLLATSGGVKLIKFCTKIIKKSFHFFYAIQAWWSKNSTKKIKYLLFPINL